MYSYVCEKCRSIFETGKKDQRCCSKSCANSCNTRNRAKIEKSLYENGLNKLNSYILGLIFSDGCLSYDKHSARYRITIAMKDQEFIEQLRTIIAPDKKLYKQKTWAGTESYSVVTRNDYDINFVRNYGITEKKSNTVEFPTIPDNYVWDFIRGIFDGDGCVYISNTHKGKKYLAVSFTSGSKVFLDKIEELFINNGLHCTRNTDTRKNTYYLKIYSHNDLKKFYELIYNTPVIFLQRKKQIFDDNDIVRPV